MKTLPKLEGIKAHQDINFFTDRNKAYAHGEDMADLGWLVSYRNDGNCIAVITTEKMCSYLLMILFLSSSLYLIELIIKEGSNL